MTSKRLTPKGGRPPKYKTVEEMQEKIDQYFIDCEGYPFLNKDGEIVLDKFGRPILLGVKPLTVTGLALALGFTSRQALLNYQGKKEFVDTVTRAKARVEAYAEARLFDRDGAMGAKFALACNFSEWRLPPQNNDEALARLDAILSGVSRKMRDDDD